LMLETGTPRPTTSEQRRAWAGAAENEIQPRGGGSARQAPRTGGRIPTATGGSSFFRQFSGGSGFRRVPDAIGAPPQTAVTASGPLINRPGPVPRRVWERKAPKKPVPGTNPEKKKRKG